MLAQGAGLEPDARDRNGTRVQVSRNLLDLAGQLSLSQNSALAIDDANRAGP